jgi:hypothetical protein
MNLEHKDEATDAVLTISSRLSSTNEQNQESVEVQDYADGAVRAWSTVAGAFLLQFYTVGVVCTLFFRVLVRKEAYFSAQVSAFGAFQDFYTTTWLKNYSASDISWIGSVQAFFQLGCAPVVGKLFDFGHSRVSIVFGSLLSSFRFVCFPNNTFRMQYILKNVIVSSCYRLPRKTNTTRSFSPNHSEWASVSAWCTCPHSHWFRST